MKFFKQITTCAFALVSIFALTGCSTGTLIESPSLEVKQGLDTSITNMQNTVTDYKITGSKTTNLQGTDVNDTVSYNMDCVVSGTLLDQKAHMKFSANASLNEQGQITIVSVNDDYYMKATESHYNLYETKSRTTTTRDTLSSALSLIAFENNIQDLINIDYIGTFSGASAYSENNYSLYSLENDSYRIELNNTTGSLDSTSLFYNKIIAIITITDGNVTKIVTDYTLKSRSVATDAWSTVVESTNYTIEYGSFTVTLPNITDYTAVTYNNFPVHDVL